MRIITIKGAPSRLIALENENPNQRYRIAPSADDCGRPYTVTINTHLPPKSRISMVRNILPTFPRRRISVLLAGILLTPIAIAADAMPAPALSTLGLSGGLNIPTARLLPAGTLEAQANNYYDRRYAANVKNGYNLLLGLPLLPYTEFSGRLAEYPSKTSRQTDTIVDQFVIRDLSANLKLQLPRLLDRQPDIAIGMTDIGGGAVNFRSKFGVVTQRLGPLHVTAGYGKGPQKLDGAFGGVEWTLATSGFSLLAEHDGSDPAIGARYASPEIGRHGFRIIASAQRSIGAKSNGVETDRNAYALALQIPLENASWRPGANTKPASDNAQIMSEHQQTSNVAPEAKPASTSSRPSPATDLKPQQTAVAPIKMPPPQNRPAEAIADKDVMLRNVRQRLITAGLERISVGQSKQDWVIEFENHRYATNETDALGIVLGVAASEAPTEVKRIRVVMKKANLAIAEISISAAEFRRFLAGEPGNGARASLQMHTGAQYDRGDVHWLEQGNEHSLSRIMIEPRLNSFIATEVGVYDYSLGLNKQIIVPLWQGAEFSANHINRASESENLRPGGIYTSSRIKPGWQSAALNQMWWLGSRLLNVSSIGGYNYDYRGLQQESTFFVPNRPDVARLRANRFVTSNKGLPDLRSSQFSYRWVSPDPSLWVEIGYNRYISRDKGPFAEIKHYFGDVAASVFYKRSEIASFAGFSLTIPLTPRKGMQPGWVQLSGPDSFSHDVATSVASTGESNLVNLVATQNTAYPYSATRFVLNQGRFSEAYFKDQLPRMRDAYSTYAQH